jgi:hypothetical protein
LAGVTVRPFNKYSKPALQLLLDKAGELFYFHKIFQHISVVLSKKGDRAGNRPVVKRHGQSVLINQQYSKQELRIG